MCFEGRAYLLPVSLVLLGLGCGGSSPSGAQPTLPVITGFSASPSPLPLGQTATLSWSVAGATQLSLDSGVGPVSGTSVTVTPSVPTTYTLSATNSAGTVHAQSSVALTCTVLVIVGPNGTVSGSLAQTLPYGGSLSPVTASPDPGYDFADWTGAGLATTSTNPLSISSVTSNLTLTAHFTPQIFTVTFSAGTGGSLSGTLSQSVPYGTSCAAVAAVPDPGWAFTGWTGPGFTPSTTNPLTVADVTANLALTAAFQDQVPDLGNWLLDHPAVASALRWQFQSPAGGNAYTPPGDADMIAWANWSLSQRDDLAAAYRDAALWLLGGATAPITLPYRGVSEAPINYYGNQSDGGTVMQWTSPADMWNIYIAHVGFSLALETLGKVPWSLATYDALSLRYLLDSSTMGWKLPYGPVSFSLGTYGGANLPALRADNRPKTPFTHPMYVYQWMTASGIIGGSRLESIGAALDWMRHNMVHFYGSDTFGNCNSIWQYKGYPPVSRILQGTTDVANGFNHWTLGCHGSVGFLAATLRALNIPVQPVWVGGHELACFLTEHRYLDHGDDPYNAVVRGAPDVPILNVLIDEATYQERFTADLTVNLNSPSAAVLANIGKAAADFK